MGVGKTDKANDFVKFAEGVGELMAWPCPHPLKIKRRLEHTKPNTRSLIKTTDIFQLNLTNK